MNQFEAKSKPLWVTFTITFISLILMFIVSLISISQIMFTKNMDQIMDIQLDVINKQIVYNFELYTNEIINASNNIQARLANTDLENDNDEATDLLKTMIILDPKYQVLSLFSKNGKVLASSDKDFSDLDDLGVEWFSNASRDNTTHHFSTPFYEDNKYEIIISKAIPTNKYKDEVVLMMQIDFTSMIELVEKSNLGKNSHISIVNEKYDYVYTSKINSAISNKEEINLFKELILGNSLLKIADEQMMFIISTITNTPWRLGAFINLNSNFAVKQNFITSIIIFSIGFLLISSLLFYFVIKRITRPLIELQNVMSEFKYSDEIIINKLEVSYPKEVEILNNNFNLMMERIDNLMKTVIKEQTEQRKSELKALQNQINPHFLYNTLDSIVYMVENEKNKDAAEMIIALSKLFKISISGGKNIISVKDELEHAKNYLLIQKVRYKDQFSFNINVIDPEILELETMKLILQPLIENALYHGINKMDDSGLITISVSYENDLINFTVKDNGYGMTQDKIDELYFRLNNDNLSDGVGLKNIYQRLKVYYGNRASLNITSEADNGTTITILIPAGDLL